MDSLFLGVRVHRQHRRHDHPERHAYDDNLRHSVSTHGAGYIGDANSASSVGDAHSAQPEETHAAPAGVCNCGIYALTQWDAIEPQALLPPVCHHPGLERYVFGLVLLWGRVIQHGHGYRAEYARPLRLLTTSLRARSDGIRSLLDAVTTCYGIPLVTRVEELSAPFREG